MLSKPVHCRCLSIIIRCICYAATIVDETRVQDCVMFQHAQHSLPQTAEPNSRKLNWSLVKSSLTFTHRVQIKLASNACSAIQYIKTPSLKVGCLMSNLSPETLFNKIKKKISDPTKTSPITNQ